MRIIFLKESTFMHKPFYHHPENPRRVLEVKSSLVSERIAVEEESIQRVDKREALKLARRIHSPEYIDYLLNLSHRAPIDIDEDTYMSRDTMDLALSFFYLAYKYALESRRVFLIGRPPGHHAGIAGATPGVSSTGFCILNNAAVAVYGFRDAGYKKIMVLDFDAHHGNGTMEIFYRDKILQVDFHQDPDTLYPHTGYPDELGEGDGYGYKVNIVLPRYTGDDLFAELVDMVENLVVKYSPEAIVVSAGFDAFENDGLADLSLTEFSYYKLGLLVEKVNVPTVIVLEGGYGIGLKRGSIAFTKAFYTHQLEYPPLTQTPRSAYRNTVETVKRVLEKASRRVLESG